MTYVIQWDGWEEASGRAALPSEKARELFDELPERQIQQSDLERVVAALVD